MIKHRVTFFLINCLVGMIGGLGEYFMYCNGFSFLQEPWTAVIFLALPLFFLLSNVAEKHLPKNITKIFALIGGYWLIFFYYSFLLMLLYFIIFLIGFIFPEPLWQSSFKQTFIYLGTVVIILAVIFGRWNAYHLVTRRIKIKTNKPLAQKLTIAFASDIHLGTILGKKFSARLVRKIQSEKPDLIILGGDIIDGNLPFVIKDGSYKNLLKLTAPFGVFSVYGNHDYYGMDLVKEKSLLPNISFLKNHAVMITDCVELTGLDDYMNCRDDAPKAHDDCFAIIADHEPWRIAQCAEAGYDLYLAGHTHAGQFFPNRIVTKKLYLLDYGYKRFAQLHAVVSNGCGFWGTPVRVGPSPEIVIIEVEND